MRGVCYFTNPGKYEVHEILDSWEKERMHVLYVSYYITACGYSVQVNMTWSLIFSILHPRSSICYFKWSQDAQSCSNPCAFPRERDDETNPGSFDQMKLFSQAIFQCHISLRLIHEVNLSHWHHLSSSSRVSRLSWPLSSLSRETNAFEEHLSIKDSCRLCYISIFNQPQRNPWILYIRV